MGDKGRRFEAASTLVKSVLNSDSVYLLFTRALSNCFLATPIRRSMCPPLLGLLSGL